MGFLSSITSREKTSRLTCNDDDIPQDYIKKNGANNYLTKPLEIVQLESIIMEYLS